MPSSQPSAAAAPNSEQRRNDKTVTNEPPKLKTALKTPPKQATNPLQFVKVGPCALYRTAQEQLSKVQEVKKVETKVKDDPEDWQSNLDNWKSSRRKRQEHIIERVVEVKKLELEEHDRNRKRCKTFSELMEERGRKLSLSLAVYNEDDANDLSDLGIGTSSGKSSVSGDTHDDSHSVLSDRDSEIDKNHSDVDNAGHENGNDSNNSRSNVTPSKLPSGTKTLVTPKSLPLKREVLNNGFHKNNGSGNNHNNQDYDSATTATTSSPEPDEYGYEATPTRNYVPRISQGFSQKLHPFDQKHEVEFSSYGKTNGLEEKRNGDAAAPVVKVDILKRREIFEKAARENENRNNNINNNRVEITNTKSIKERLSILERQKSESEFTKSPRHSIDSGNSIKERFNMEKQSSFEKDVKARDMLADELESVKPVKEILSNLEKFRGNCAQDIMTANAKVQSYDDEYNSKFIKERLISLDAARCKEMDKHSNNFYSEQQANMRMENLTPSERSSSPDSEYRAPRATFHQSLDSLDADASSGPDTFERVQSLEELDYHQSRRYPASSSSAEILNDTDREDSGIHTADASCSVSQADEPIEEEIGLEKQYPPMILEEKTEFRSTIESTLVETSKSLEKVEEKMANMTINNSEPCVVVLTEKVKKQPADAAAVAAAAAAAAELAAKEVEEEKEEERVAEPATATTTAAAEKKPEPLAEEQAPVLDEPLSHLEEPEEEEDDRELEDDPEEDFPEKSSTMAETVAPPPPPAPVRPTTLMLERTTLEPEFLSPLSPVSSNPILPLSFSSDEEIVTGLSFPLGPPTSVEPPKEKPPPPPVDLSDEENHPIEPLKRLNSTRRIKKELRSRRSDFLGIEGFNDDELERELTLTKPPDMAAILAEERRIEQLHRRSYDTDSNYEQDSSHERDSGVELGQAEDWTKQPVSPDMSQHSRQSSEPFGASVTSSEEDEITKKEREIIEVLEKEEQWRYENNREMDSDIGEKLAHKLRELEEEKMQLERERASKEACDNQQQRRRHQEPTAETLRMNEENLRKQEEILRREDEARQQELEKQLAEEKLQLKAQGDRIQEQQLKMQNERENRNVELCRKEDLPIRIIEKNAPEIKAISPAPSSNGDECSRQEVLRVERELLQLEQEELKRQRSNLAYREQKQQQLAEQLQEQWKSLQDVAQISPPPRPPYAKPQPPINYRASMPNLQMQEAATAAAIGQRRRPPPPPIPPAKPLRLVEQRQRDVTIRNSRIPSADSIPQQVETPLRPSRSVVALTNVQQQHQQAINAQQMSRQTLQALSAAPRPRMIQADQWVQRRKSDIPRGSQDFNYQHWLIQEAEQRRISEKNQRSPAHKPVHVTGTSVPYSVVSPPRPIENKPLPDSIIQTLTQRVQSRVQEKPLSPRRRLEHSTSQEHLHMSQYQHPQQQPQQQKHHQSPQQQQQKQPQPMQQQQKQPQPQQAYQQLQQQQQQQQSSPQQNKQQQSPSSNNTESQEKMLSVSGKKKCSHCGDELGRGAAMIIESLRLFYHMECFKCCVCHVKLGDGLMGTDVRVRNHKLHCHNCYSSDDGVKFSCV